MTLDDDVDKGPISVIFSPICAHDTPLFFVAFHMPPLAFYRRLDRHRFHSTQKLPHDRSVDPQPAECKAPRLPEHEV
jgi:hypothetical protein